MESLENQWNVTVWITLPSVISDKISTIWPRSVRLLRSKSHHSPGSKESSEASCILSPLQQMVKLCISYTNKRPCFYLISPEHISTSHDLVLQLHDRHKCQMPQTNVCFFIMAPNKALVFLDKWKIKETFPTCNLSEPKCLWFSLKIDGLKHKDQLGSLKEGYKTTSLKTLKTPMPVGASLPSPDPHGHHGSLLPRKRFPSAALVFFFRNPNDGIVWGEHNPWELRYIIW